MTEKTKKEHIRKHKNINIDYIKAFNLSLTETEIKSVGELKYADDYTLAQVITSLAENLKQAQVDIQALRNKNEELEQKVLQVEKVNLEIIKGKLALWVNYIKQYNMVHLSFHY